MLKKMLTILLLLGAIQSYTQEVIRQVPRLTVVEEFTGVNCSWCSRGWIGMGLVKHERADKACVIAWHKYKATDPMYIDNYANFGAVSYPKCCIDRRLTTDPYDGEDHHGILYEVDQINQELATVEIQIEASYTNETRTQVSIIAHTEFLTDAEGYTIAFALTADSLAGAKRVWWQANAYASYEPDYVDNDPLLTPLCRGGEMGDSQIKVVYDDVLIGSTYGANGLTTLPSFDSHLAGEFQTTTGIIDMPVSETLLTAILYHKVFATALVIDDHGKIANAARCRVLMPGESSIEQITSVAQSSSASEFYDLQGRPADSSKTGLTIRNGKIVWKNR